MPKSIELIELIKISKIPILTIRIGTEKFKINTRKELEINQNDVNHEILVHPKIYGFLGLTYSRLKGIYEELESEKKHISAKLYLKYKGSTVNGRPLSDDVAKAKVEVNEDYRNIIGRLLHIKSQLTQMEVILDAFKQKKELIQTLSSNQRSIS